MEGPVLASKLPRSLGPVEDKDLSILSRIGVRCLNMKDHEMGRAIEYLNRVVGLKPGQGGGED